MLRTPAQFSRHALYFTLQVSGFLICLLGVILFRVMPVALIIYIIDFFQAQEHEDLIFLILFWVIVILIGFPCAKRVIGWGSKFMDYSQRHKTGYLALLGDDYKKPTLQEYGLTQEEYYSYNRRFQFENTVIPYGSAVAALFYGNWSSDAGGFVKILVAAISTGLTVYCALWLFNRRLARRYPNHEKVERYTKAERIYDAIQKELREQRINQNTLI